MNEYVEISKDYSSPESGKFINGVVNNILKDLTKKNLLEKMKEVHNKFYNFKS